MYAAVSLKRNLRSMYCSVKANDRHGAPRGLFALRQQSYLLLMSIDLCNITDVILFCLVKSSVLTYNAALNRSSYQSSVYNNSYGFYPPNLANDGSRETNATRDNIPRCAHSQRETNPWWAVDLGRKTTIYRVHFTNRAGPSGML